MQWFFLVIIIICVVLLLGSGLARSGTGSLAGGLRFAGALALLLAAAGLIYGGRFGLAIPFIWFAIMMLRGAFGGPRGFGIPGSGRRSSGSVSKVRSRQVEMVLDHDSGDIEGGFIAGSRQGTALSDLDLSELATARQELKTADPQGAQLLEAYLDRRFPDWREGEDGPDQDEAGSAAPSSAMTRDEAYETLGLEPGAKASEIRAAHRRLMKKLHPDQGGSTFLAARVNQAKDFLLGKRS